MDPRGPVAEHIMSKASNELEVLLRSNTVGVESVSCVCVFHRQDLKRGASIPKDSAGSVNEEVEITSDVTPRAEADKDLSTRRAPCDERWGPFLALARIRGARRLAP